MRCLILAFCLSAASCARAELTCEQVGKVILTTVEYRNQGYSLTQITDSIDQSKAANKFTDLEIEKLRAIVKIAFLQTMSPKELLDLCAEEQKEKAGK